MKTKNPIIRGTKYFTKGNKFTLFMVGIIAIIAALCMMIIPKFLQLIIDAALLGDPKVYNSPNPVKFILNYAPLGSIDMLLILLGCILGISGLHASIMYCRRVFCKRSALRYENKIRDISYRKFMKDTLNLRRQYQIGEIFTILNNDIVDYKEAYFTHLPFMLDELLVMTLSLIFLLQITPLFLIIVCFNIPMILIGFLRYYAKLNIVNENTRNASSDLNDNIQEDINAYKINNVFYNINGVKQRFDKRNTNYLVHFILKTKLSAKFNLLFNCMTILTMVMSISFGSYLAIKGTITIGQFATLNTYVMSLYNCFIAMINHIAMIQHSGVCGERIMNLLDKPVVLVEQDNPIELDRINKIELKNVSFGKHKVLKNINVTVTQGQRIGIIGESGSGKTLFLNLVNRFLDCTEGEVLINDINIKKYSISSLRDAFACVFESSYLFSDTIAFNIKLAVPDASEEDIIRVAKQANAYNFIIRQPEGFLTMLGEKGIGLSGGQRQRVAIARALLKTKGVLVFDNAFSALDIRTEKNIMQAINTHYSDNIMFSVSHKAETLKGFDEILVFDKGEIVERGKFKDLINIENGKFKTIYEAQQLAKNSDLDAEVILDEQ